MQGDRKGLLFASKSRSGEVVQRLSGAPVMGVEAADEDKDEELKNPIRVRRKQRSSTTTTSIKKISAGPCNGLGAERLRRKH